MIKGRLTLKRLKKNYILLKLYRTSYIYTSLRADAVVARASTSSRLRPDVWALRGAIHSRARGLCVLKKSSLIGDFRAALVSTRL